MPGSPTNDAELILIKEKIIELKTGLVKDHEDLYKLKARRGGAHGG